LELRVPGTQVRFMKELTRLEILILARTDQRWCPALVPPKKFENLKSLDLSSNRIGDDRVNSLRTVPTLQRKALRDLCYTPTI
jgi:hypothetical protein